MVDKEPRVSIGLPVFNAEKYLCAVLDSLLAQTYRDFELIISDNASTDRTREICQQFASRDSRIRYYRNEKNLGAAPNFNRVFHLARGEYFKWAPYDDLLAPDFLRHCVEILDQSSVTVLCYSRAEIIDSTGKYVVDYDPGPPTVNLKPSKRFRNLLLCPEYAIQQMGLVRSQALRKTGLHRSFPSSDEVLLAELSLLGGFHEIADRLYFYRKHEEQSTQGKQRSRVAFFDTSLGSKFVLPTWLYLFASVGAISRAPVPESERLACYLTIGRWCCVPSHFRALTKDLLIAVSECVKTSLGRFTPRTAFEKVEKETTG